MTRDAPVDATQDRLRVDDRHGEIAATKPR
jgi:phage/plasmid primase-like uncharacterized protein